MTTSENTGYPTKQQCWDEFWVAVAQGYANSLIRRASNRERPEGKATPSCDTR